MSNHSCPVCGSDRYEPSKFIGFVVCLLCSHETRLEPIAKAWATPPEMAETEKTANRSLANWLYDMYKPATALDIGSGIPWLSAYLRHRGCDSHAMDGAPAHPEIITDDWETYDPFLNGHENLPRKFDLISAIHVLEYFENPAVALSKMVSFLSDDGVVFLRSPNRDMDGIDRYKPTEDMQLRHIFSNKSITMLLARAGFHVIWSDSRPGWGQSSFILRKHAPRISLCMIVKNEAKNIVDCLATVRSFVDEMIVVDTGSTDDTVALAESAGAKVYKSKFFFPTTPVGEFHFAQARNEALSYGTGDWLFWMDADDRFNKPELLKLEPFRDAYETWIEYGGMRFTHVRFFRNNWGVRFEGAIHEYPVVHHLRQTTLNGPSITHLHQIKATRGSRNVSILEREYQRDPTHKRTLFYLANTYKDMGKYDQAIEIYNKYIALGGNFKDELFLAHYYVSESHFHAGRLDEAIKASLRAMLIDDRWAETYLTIGESYFRKRDLKKAIGYLGVADGLPLPATNMFVQKERYDIQPKRLLSQCWEQLGDMRRAAAYSTAAGDFQRASELTSRK